ncbi:MAG: acyltransferase, partial [Flavobacteriales bacterium]|nr:acyltransferase [Flavobacteriales bacterium]
MNENEYKVASKRMRFFISLICLLLPQKVKHWLLIKVLGYEIHSSAIIGLSLICPGHLIMKKKSWIGGLNVCKDGVELLSIGEYGRIGNLNWITAAPLGVKSYSDEVDRKPMLIVGNHSAITRRHLIDCTNLVKIGKYSTFAGFRSQILTHAVDLLDCKQASHPVLIGDYCFIG